MSRSGDCAGLLDNPAIKKLGRLPAGWKYARNTLTEPTGWRWAHNGKSIFSGKRQTALVKVMEGDGR